MTERFAARRRSASARATRTLGRRLGRLLRPGDVVGLEGDLGAGKTELVRGACEGAGVAPSEVSSPSFAIVATYRGRIPVHHADLYRIGDEDELYGTGFGDLVGGEGALLVEWSDRVPGALPEERITIRLAHDARAPDVRHVEIEGVGGRAATVARTLAGRGERSGRRPPGARRAPPQSRSGSRSRSRSGSRSRSRSGSRSGSGSRPRSRPRSRA